MRRPGALEAEGAIIVPTRGFMTPEMMECMSQFFEARTCNDILAMDAATKEKVLPFIHEWATWRAPGFTGSQVMHAYTQVMAMREAAVRLVGQFDFVLSPTSPVLPFSAEICAPGNDPRNAFPHIQYTVAYNMMSNRLHPPTDRGRAGAG